MKKQITHQFVNKLVALTQQILIDQAKILGGMEEKKVAVLIFSDQDLNEDDHKNALREAYFPIERQGIVPFADDTEEDKNDRLFYLKQIRSEIKNITENYQHFSVVLPSPTNITETQSSQRSSTSIYTFSGDQLVTIYKVVFKLCHDFEQQQINALKKIETGETVSVDLSSNQQGESSLKDLGEAILIQGISGNFDVVLTRQELEDMNQSIQRAEEIAKLKGIPLDAEGKPIFKLFMATDELTDNILAEIQKRPLLTRYMAIPFEQIPSENSEEESTPKDTLLTLQKRRALKFQLGLLEAGKGKIQIIQDVQIDLNGNAFLIAKDENGNEFIVKTDLKTPSDQPRNYFFTISAPGDNGINRDLILAFSAEELKKLQTASIIDLFEEHEARVIEGQPSTGQIKVAKHQPKLKKEGQDIDSQSFSTPVGFKQPKNIDSQALGVQIDQPTASFQPSSSTRTAQGNQTADPAQIAVSSVRRKKLVKIKLGNGIYLKKKVPAGTQPVLVTPQGEPIKPWKGLKSAQTKKITQIVPKTANPPTSLKSPQTAQPKAQITQSKAVNPAMVAAAGAGGVLIVGSSVLTAFTVLFS